MISIWGMEQIDSPLVRFSLNSQRGRRVVARVSGLKGVSRVRVWPFLIVLVVFSIVSLTRLIQLTVVEGAYRRDLADENRVFGVRRAAARGVLFDRNGDALVTNAPLYKRQVPDTTVAQAAFESITKDEAVALSHNSGERIFFDVSRTYLCGRACATLLGYMSEVDGAMLQEFGTDYVLGDYAGMYGIEKMYERELRGVPGSELLEVDAAGSLVREMGVSEPVAGTSLHLTVDTGLQRVLYDAFDGRIGAAIAQVPQTGEVLALVSSPSFDPNNVADSLSEPDSPFFNRAIGGRYPPGSTFKIVTAVAALEDTQVDGSTSYVDTGEVRVGTYRYGNWFYDQYGRTDGEVDMVKALQRSNDIYFYKVSEEIGPDLLASWARDMGYEDAGGLEGLGSIPGLIPDPSWKERTKGERWFLGNTYHMSIGQGDVLASPLHVNRMMGAIAAGGVLCDPLVLKRDIGQRSCVQLNLSEMTLDLIHEGLVKACQSGGTGAPFFRYSPQVACKTGTAQQGGEDDLAHAWFTVYAPADNPEIALTVLLEGAGSGSEVAGPVALEGIKYWMDKR